MVVEINYYLHRAIEDIFDQEVRKLLKLITNRYGSEFCFTYEELLAFYQKKCQLRISYSPKKKLAIKSKEPPKDLERCCARVWSGGFYEKKKGKETFGDRCGRSKCSGSDYCSQHSRDLVHGRYDKPPSKIVRGFFIKVNDKSYYD